VLLVNPTHLYGVDVALALAAVRPDIPFTFAESLQLDDSELAALEDDARQLGNIEIRRFTPNIREVYARARIVLAPYRYPGRSRVIAEAQCSGIPALASTRYGVAEEVGDAGIVLDPDGPAADWTKALAELWDDHDRYERFVERAYARSRAPERQPEALAAMLEAALRQLVESDRS
jgi:glycosyltransferase involved in cell wall biosynthesis